MKDLFASFFRISISTSLIFLVFGLLLFFNPVGIIVAISIFFGVVAIIYGIGEIVVYARNPEFNTSDLITGIISIAIGILLVVKTNIIATIIPLIIGICIFILGIRKISLALNLKKDKYQGWVQMLVIGILTLTCGFILVLNPIKGAFITTQIIGLIIAIYAVIDIIDSLILKKHIDDVKKTLTDAKVIDVKDA